MCWDDYGFVWVNKDTQCCDPILPEPTDLFKNAQNNKQLKTLTVYRKRDYE